MLQKGFLKKFDIVILLTTMCLVAFGVIAIYSATYSSDSNPGHYEKQLIFGIIGLVLMIVVSYLPPKHIGKASYIIYIISLILLAGVLVFGKTISGQKSWYSIGGFGIQPAEFAKLATVIAIAAYLSRESEKRESEFTLRDFFVITAMVIIPVGLIQLQPDMGTNLVFLVMIIPICLWAGMKPFYLFVIIAPIFVAITAFLEGIFGDMIFYTALGVVAILLLLFKQKLYLKIAALLICIFAGFSADYVYDHLQPYQQRRIMTVFDPSSDPLGSGYNVIQSKVAIGSGGFAGKGYLQGTQTQLKFIPEQWTDFIFCMVGEEFGFIGSVFLITLFLIIIIKLIANGYMARSKYLGMCCIGFASIILIHLFINIGMTIGILPVIGIPLPLVSYGISSMLSFMLMLGIGMNAYRNRNIIF